MDPRRYALTKNILCFFESLSLLLLGAWWAGCSTQEIYYGDYLANTSDVVVVSMNYRLGALGFLYNGHGIQGNYGFMDQVLALQWVQRNIRHFGGDPNQVTLFGQR